MDLRAARTNETGGVLIEAAVTIAFLAAFVPVLADLFFLSNTYLSLNQITREALVTNIKYPESLVVINGSYDYPTPGTPPISEAQELSDLSVCTDGGTYKLVNSFPLHCAYSFIRWRVRKLIESHDARIDADNVDVRIQLEPDRVMRVSLETNFKGVSPFFRNHKVRNSATARYLGNS